MRVSAPDDDHHTHYKEYKTPQIWRPLEDFQCSPASRRKDACSTTVPQLSCRSNQGGKQSHLPDLLYTCMRFIAFHIQAAD